MSNCLIWALWMFFTRGGYLLVRKSMRSWVPHFQWSANRLVWYEYIPRAYKKDYYWWPSLLFRGRVKMSLGPEQWPAR